MTIFRSPALMSYKNTGLLDSPDTGTTSDDWIGKTEEELINNPVRLEALLDEPAEESNDLETLLLTPSSGIEPDTSSSDIYNLLIDRIAKAYNFELTNAFRDSYETIAKAYNFELTNAFRDFHEAIEKALYSELYDALYDLYEATDEALEEGFPVPSEIALENAECLLREMYWISPRRFEVYPTPDGEIAIDAPGGHGRSVLLLCDSEGGALCLVNMNGTHRRARYDTTKTLPDGFVREALDELHQRDDKVMILPRHFPMTLCVKLWMSYISGTIKFHGYSK